MRNSSKGFGLIGVFAAVVFLIVTAVVSASAKAESICDSDRYENSYLK